ncbi:hypothetical protein [Kineosporia sp. R_H_3]|uniref:hypothetical protein n=1 Tax=Kineosporia sp. R_H_3 TaxID=1961848 RepID=UPI000B4B066E|nr:hypothetical protein [Kineosporia sp. R_H_3]
MRLLLAVASCVLLAACSSSGPPAAGQVSTVRATTAAGAQDACRLLTETDLTNLVGFHAQPEHGRTGGLPHCRWWNGKGAYVQAASVTSPEWAQALPEVARDLEPAGLVSNQQNLESLRTAAARVTAGEALEPDEACSLFSQMLELQGQPAGSTSVVTVFPTQESPQGVTGQVCTDGRFSTILVYDVKGLRPDTLTPAVAALLPTVHERARAI